MGAGPEIYFWGFRTCYFICWVRNSDLLENPYTLKTFIKYTNWSRRIINTHSRKNLSICCQTTLGFIAANYCKRCCFVLFACSKETHCASDQYFVAKMMLLMILSLLRMEGKRLQTKSLFAQAKHRRRDSSSLKIHFHVRRGRFMRSELTELLSQADLLNQSIKNFCASRQLFKNKFTNCICLPIVTHALYGVT